MPQILEKGKTLHTNNFIRVMFILLALLIVGQSGAARERINPRDVRIVNANDANWCAVEEKCKYVKRYDCRRNRARQEHCDIRAQKDAARYGANTYVYQFTGEVEDASVFDDDDGAFKYFLGFGHAYFCQGETKSESEAAFTRKLPGELKRLQIFTQDKQDRCEFAKSCKFIRNLDCHTSRTNAEYRCKVTIGKKAVKLSANRLVIKNEERKPDSYKVEMDLYRCEI